MRIIGRPDLAGRNHPGRRADADGRLHQGRAEAAGGHPAAGGRARLPGIAQAMDDKGIPETCERRMEVVRWVMGAARTSGVSDENVYFDPLAMTLATNTDSALATLDTRRAIRREFPDAHLTMGLSNISFGLPAWS